MKGGGGICAPWAVYGIPPIFNWGLADAQQLAISRMQENNFLDFNNHLDDNIL